MYMYMYIYTHIHVPMHIYIGRCVPLPLLLLDQTRPSQVLSCGVLAGCGGSGEQAYEVPVCGPSQTVAPP